MAKWHLSVDMDASSSGYGGVADIWRCFNSGSIQGEHYSQAANKDQLRSTVAKTFAVQGAPTIIFSRCLKP